MAADGSGKQKFSSCGDRGELLIHVDSPERKICFSGFKEKKQGLVRVDWPAFSPWLVWIPSA